MANRTAKRQAIDREFVHNWTVALDVLEQEGVDIGVFLEALMHTAADAPPTEQAAALQSALRECEAPTPRARELLDMLLGMVARVLAQAEGRSASGDA